MTRMEHRYIITWLDDSDVDVIWCRCWWQWYRTDTRLTHDNIRLQRTGWDRNDCPCVEQRTSGGTGRCRRRDVPVCCCKRSATTWRPRDDGGRFRASTPAGEVECQPVVGGQEDDWAVCMSVNGDRLRKNCTHTNTRTKTNINTLGWHLGRVAPPTSGGHFLLFAYGASQAVLLLLNVNDSTTFLALLFGMMIQCAA